MPGDKTHRFQKLLTRECPQHRKPPHRQQHGAYIRRYLATGEAKVIGTGREVTMLAGNGALVRVMLSIGEIKIGTSSLFTAILRKTDKRSA